MLINFDSLFPNVEAYFRSNSGNSKHGNFSSFIIFFYLIIIIIFYLSYVFHILFSILHTISITPSVYFIFCLFSRSQIHFSLCLSLIFNYWQCLLVPVVIVVVCSEKYLSFSILIRSINHDSIQPIFYLYFHLPLITHFAPAIVIAHTHTYTYIRKHTHTLTLSLTYTHRHRTHALTLSLTHILSLSLTYTLSHTHTHTNTTHTLLTIAKGRKCRLVAP